LPAPLVPWAIAVMTGIIAARYLNILAAEFFIVLLVCSVLGATAALLYGRQSAGNDKKHLVLSISLFIGFASLGGLRYNLVYFYYPKNHIIAYCDSEQPRLATLRGVIYTDPYIAKTTGTFAQFDFMHEPRTIFVLDCRSVLTTEGWRKASGLMQAVVNQPAPHLRLGQEVQVDCWISLRAGPNNPGQYDRRDSHRGSRNLVACRINNAEAITLLKDSSPDKRLVYSLRRRIQVAARTAIFEDNGADDDGPTPDRRQAGEFLSALLLGQRQEIDAGLNDVFMRTGAMHFLSVSGLHIGLFVGFVWWICWWLRFPRRLQGLLSLSALVVFLLIVPPRAPVIRAAIISSIFCLAYIFRRKTSPLNLLALAAMVILLTQPLELFSASFQLSFVAVMGLFIFAQPLYQGRLFSKDQLNLRILPDDRPSLWRRFPLNGLWGLLCVAITAWVVTLPLTAYHFNRIALAGIPASMATYPLVFLTMLAGFFKLLVGLVLPSLSVWLTEPLNTLGQLTIWVNQQIALLPYSCVITARPAFWLIAIFYTLLILAGWSTRKSLGVGRSIWTGLIIWVILFSIFITFNKLHRSRDTALDVLAVGHGCATVVELPDGRVFCYDIGSLSDYNVAENVVAPYLRSRGIGRIEGLFISHPNIDHFCGAVDLCRLFPVGCVYLNNWFAHKETGPAKMLLDLLEEIGQPVRFVARGFNIASPDKGEKNRYRLELLWPVPNAEPNHLSDNDSCLVLKISDNNGAILLCGDIGSSVQEQLMKMETASGLKADILLLPHHGSISSILPEFVESIDPEFCLNSCGFIKEGYPQELRRLLPERTIFHTYNRGAITCRLTPGGPVATTFHPKP